ncbi:MAG: hypothetical protein HIU86_05195 [Acidobacteria bacterium]|nr:hypothetical protein [Acidobacteriota bacterium]
MDDDSRTTVEAHLPDVDRSDITIAADDGATVVQPHERHTEIGGAAPTGTAV